MSLIVKLLFASRLVGLRLMDFLKEVILPLVAVTVISSALSFLASMWLDGISRLLVAVLVGFLSVWLSMFYIGLKPGERTVVIGKIRTWLRR